MSTEKNSMPNGLTRRSVAKGYMWAAPAIAVASASPAVAASAPLTAQNTKFIMYQALLEKLLVGSMFGGVNCSSSVPPIGFIDTLPCNDVTSPAMTSPNSCSGSNNPSATSGSDGFWFQSSNGGTVQVQSITLTYTFDQNVTLNNCPSNPTVASTQYSGATTTWTSCNVLNGWVATQTSPTTITMTYGSTGAVATELSTATSGGWNTGYFINLTFSQCKAANLTTSGSVTYVDATGTHTAPISKSQTF